MNSLTVRRMTLFAIALIGAAGCATSPETTSSFASEVSKAHRAALWHSHAAFESDATIHFGGNKIFEGQMLFDTPVGKSRLTRADGVVAVFDGQNCWVSPADADFPRARFHVLTWPYFTSVAMKLADPGVNIEPLGMTDVNGHPQEAAKMTFAPGTGDAPDDWYILHTNPKTHRLEAMAYIVTYGKSQTEAEKAPHAITYEDYRNVAGVPVAMHWQFWNWNAEEGIHGDPIGDVTLRNARFVDVSPGAFAKPSNAKEAEMP